MKLFSPNRIPWAGLLASAITIVSGLVMSLVVVLVFSDSPRRDTILLAVVFGSIILVPVMALRPPKGPKAKKDATWWKFWRRRRRKKEMLERYWRRKRGQDHHKPFGTPEHAKPKQSTFVAVRRKPTEP